MFKGLKDLVVAGVARVPAPVVAITKSKTFGMGCVVVGGALTAFGRGECTGTEAIIGVGIGAGVIFQRLATEKVLQALLRGKG